MEAIIQSQKVVCYVVHGDRLLVFTHEDALAGIQVPAGTIEPGEDPAGAAVRETFEETTLRARVIRPLGVMDYDFRPAKPEIAHRHYFLMELVEPDPPERWIAGDPFPSDGSEPPVWTCWWVPLRRAHVLSAGFGQAIGRMWDE